MAARLTDLDLLATFLEIYRGGSLTSAAARRGLTQPAVSGQLAKLEKELGEPLFVRGGRGVTPTPRADDLARRVGQHVDQLRTALDPGGTLEGTVRIGGAAEFMTVRGLPALAPLTRRGLRFEVTFGLAADLLAALRAAKLDVVLSSVRPAAGFTATPFTDEEFLLVGPPLLARTVDQDVLATDPARALEHLPLVAYDGDLPIVRRYWRSEFGTRPANTVAVTVPDLRAVLAAVIAGAGVSALPRYLAEPALAAGSVEQLHHPEVPPLNTLYVVTRGTTTPATDAVAEHLRSRDWGVL
ncbi:LysR family transcriptional regulator [Lentzea flaviverrucosa]|uniref:DNA-binding transcriptional regulator, LysR family n=1 Tax=Lentzea flaviverrucosa TaxID=200379 RepID=A0A1H9FQ16_9PSEU|nr:LysR family transcriptional regulator [Lentzea flaviverrucosa]RDI35138.1 DNA-binding transcriptional LysR family regulator [Lentzea flaviverrucosa]SEQ39899.1 DNA-binding transcriptional regulator, LysR family [Lentzea flaviverrucosa]